MDMHLVVVTTLFFMGFLVGNYRGLFALLILLLCFVPCMLFIQYAEGKDISLRWIILQETAISLGFAMALVFQSLPEFFKQSKRS